MPESRQPPATVRVRLFAALREQAGWSERPVAIADGATARSLWRQLDPLGSGPATAPALPSGLRVAINQRFAAADTVLADGDELAFLPPISGG